MLSPLPRHLHRALRLLGHRGVRPRGARHLAAAPHFGLWREGAWAEAAGGGTAEVRNPATGELVATCASAEKEDVDLAVRAADAAFKRGDWSDLNPRARGRVLARAAELLRENLGELVELETRQTGRCLREYKAQLGRVPEWFEYHASYAAAKGFEGRLPALTESDHVNMVWRVPLGVCGLITPWNHPVLIAAKKISVALAAGNTVVVKPPLEAPLTVLRLAELLSDAGLPPSTLQVLPGDGPAAGDALARHPVVEKLDFTGGTATGLLIQKSMAECGRVRSYCAELGGNAPVLVFADTRSVEEAVDGVLFSAYVASGQTCVSGKRILVQKQIFQEFQEILTKKVSNLKVGDPLEAQTDLGPLISARQLAGVEDQVLRAVAAGAAPLTGGRRAAERLEGALREGHFYEPTVLSNVTVDNPAFVEEIFGPVVSLSPFADEDEAISLANASEYGLGGAMWTEDVRKAFRVARRLRCGLTWVNCHHRNDPSSPWGGFGQSGIGRENGPEAFEEYTTTKSLTIRTNDTAENWFGSRSARYG